jgi:hypothetical protein
VVVVVPVLMLFVVVVPELMLALVELEKPVLDLLWNMNVVLSSCYDDVVFVDGVVD